jgi:NAD(P)-dependent dehydrogenase (short-subunit alcohol dehydrogenase family)
VVTGGASNIGRAIVHEFATEGARIVLNDIDEPQSEKVRAEALERGASLWAVGDDEVFNPNQIEFMLKDTPMRRLTTAEDVGRAVLWFSSPTAARQVTGQLISVSGGYTMP